MPGIGAAAAKALASGHDKCTNTNQLIARFLFFRAAGTTSREQCDAMWYWLQAKGITAHRAGIVHSVAEKVNKMIPGHYDSAAF